MTKMSRVVAKAMEYQEGNGYLNDIRVESFGHLLADYVLQGAEYSIDLVDTKQINISEGIISFGDQLSRVFASEFRVIKPDTIYYIGYLLNQGYVFGPTESSENYMRLWSLKTNSTGAIGNVVDYRGVTGYVRFKGIYDGVYLNTAEVQAAIDNAIAATTSVSNVVSEANALIITLDAVVYDAENALQDANMALTSANTATTNAETAITKTNTAIANAETAITKANSANTTAEMAITNVNIAKTNAETATNNANNATTATNTAITNAVTATTNANNATTATNTAINSANTATTNANTARDSANTAATNANTAKTNTETATAAANAVANNTKFINPYAVGTAYLKNNIVTYNGSSFMALQNTTGNSPPTSPTTQNTWWALIASKGDPGTQGIQGEPGPRGTDGTGSVSKVNNVSPSGDGNVTLTAANLGAVAIVTGKQLSTEDYSTAEKTKLASLSNYVHPTTAGDKHIPTGGATNQILKYSASGTAVWGNIFPSDIAPNVNSRFVSDTQIADWNARETTTGAQTKATQALNDAKIYTDGQRGIIESRTTDPTSPQVGKMWLRSDL